VAEGREKAVWAGTAISVSFVLDGLEVQALNGGPAFSFTEAISLFVLAETQDEIDDLWEKLMSKIDIAQLEAAHSGD
jgi:predicted 3-demethylubiquinone-9 3-methyltransferase (glyoxalase superfamily)